MNARNLRPFEYNHVSNVSWCYFFIRPISRDNIRLHLITRVAGEMDKLRGYASVGGSVAYAPQQAWIQNLSLKDNITFGQRFDPAWYNTVVDACALRADFDTLPAGDDTEIGEKVGGMTSSMPPSRSSTDFN